MEKLPIIEVTSDNFAQVWPSLSKAVKDATFVAMDCVSATNDYWDKIMGYTDNSSVLTVLQVMLVY